MRVIEREALQRELMLKGFDVFLARRKVAQLLFPASVTVDRDKWEEAEGRTTAPSKYQACRPGLGFPAHTNCSCGVGGPCRRSSNNSNNARQLRATLETSICPQDQESRKAGSEDRE